MQFETNHIENFAITVKPVSWLKRVQLALIEIRELQFQIKTNRLTSYRAFLSLLEKDEAVNQLIFGNNKYFHI